jgi:hypothetical protein
MPHHAGLYFGCWVFMVFFFELLVTYMPLP